MCYTHMLSAAREFKHHTKTYLGRKCIYVLIYTQAEFLSNLIVEEQPGVEGGGEGGRCAYAKKPTQHHAI